MVSADLQIYPIRGCPAPRQTRRDRYKPSGPVMRYRAFRDEVALRGVKIDPDRFYHLVFLLAPPRSWSQRKRVDHVWGPHRQKPDKDNLEKALLDALFGDDSHIYDGRVTKLWAPTDAILIANHPIPLGPGFLAHCLAKIPAAC